MQNIVMVTVENSFAWFRNYLSERKQIVKFKLTSSDYLTIKCGVPQGSVLEPLLFFRYVNDVCKNYDIFNS